MRNSASLLNKRR